MDYHPKGGMYMKSIGKFFARMFDGATSNVTDIQREWDKQRAKAMSPAEIAEIDAIFSRSV